LRIDNAESSPTKRVGFGISTAVNNFIQGSADRDFCMFNGSTTASPILFGVYDAGLTNVQEAARISAARRLLINTTLDAGFRLDVNGTARVQGAFTATGNGSFNGVHIGLGNTTNTSTSNTAVGLEALFNNTSATGCTAVGQSALRGNNGSNNSAFGRNTMRLNTSSSANSAFGAEALYTNNGSQNNAFGYRALYFNTTGTDNNAVGWQALYNNTTGNGNIGIGTATFQFLTSGSSNIALGGSAGRYISGGFTQNTISDNSIFIGNAAYPLANNETNQIVIGHNTVGLGSNTTVLGNSSTLFTALYGNLLVGTTTNGASKLRIVGLPTSAVGLSSGDIYDNLGILTIVP
jgi:hypothetical protein